MIPGSVVVGYLSGGDTRLEFTKSISAAQVHAITSGVPLIGQQPFISGPRIAAGRNHLVRSFLATDGEWLFMVDDDMTFTPDTISRFLESAHPTETPVLAGLTWGVGRDGIFPTLWRFDDRIGELVRFDSWPDNALLKVDGTGAACLFIHRTVFEQMAELEFSAHALWFEETGAGQHTVGEDMTFCLRLRAMGVPIFVDTAIQFGHVKPRIIDADEYHRWITTHRYLITGVGDASLHFVAAVLSSASLPTGVGRMFRPDGYEASPTIRGDASWMALPWLGRFQGYVLHVTRHPLALLDVYLESRLFSGDPSFSSRFTHALTFTKEHAPEVWDQPSELERAMAFVWIWNRRIEEKAHARVQVETVTGNDLVDMVRYAGAMHQGWELQVAVDQVRAEVTIPDPALGWDDLPDGMLKRNLRKLADDYGYE
jgi:hypothetical protein